MPGGGLTVGASRPPAPGRGRRVPRHSSVNLASGGAGDIKCRAMKKTLLWLLWGVLFLVAAFLALVKPPFALWVQIVGYVLAAVAFASMAQLWRSRGGEQ